MHEFTPTELRFLREVYKQSIPVKIDLDAPPDWFIWRDTNTLADVFGIIQYRKSDDKRYLYIWPNDSERARRKAGMHLVQEPVIETPKTQKAVLEDYLDKCSGRVEREMIIAHLQNHGFNPKGNRNNIYQKLKTYRDQRQDRMITVHRVGDISLDCD